jgi:hypothetical protein
MRRCVAGFALLGFGCDQASHYDPIVVDIAANCNAVEVIVDARDLDPDDGSDLRVLAAASDHPERSSWWLLVSAPETPGDPQTLQLWHLADRAIDARVPLGLPPDLLHALDLRPGPRPGEAWLLRRSPGSMSLWQVDAAAEDPLVGVSNDLGAFPVTNDLCRDNEFVFEARCPTTDWHRDLVFLGGAPFLVSVPPFSPDATISVYLGELDRVAPSLLYLRQERLLPFASRCDPELSLEDFTVCEERNKSLSYEEIHVLARQHDPRTTFTRLVLLRESALDNVRSFFPEVVVVSLGLVDGSISGSLVRADSPFGIPSLGSPAGLAVDGFATYVLHATRDHRPQLLRVPNLGTTVEPVTGVRLESDVELMQLDEDLALSRIERGTWTITKLFPDAPDQSQRTEHQEATPFVRVDPSGPAAFVGHRAEGGPDLLRVRCVERE